MEFKLPWEIEYSFLDRLGVYTYKSFTPIIHINYLG